MSNGLLMSPKSPAPTNPAKQVGRRPDGRSRGCSCEILSNVVDGGERILMD